MSCDTQREVIEKLGGIDAVASLTGAKYKTVSAWQTHYGRFPSWTFLVLTAALTERGLTAPTSLWNFSTRERSTDVAAE